MCHNCLEIFDADDNMQHLFNIEVTEFRGIDGD